MRKYVHTSRGKRIVNTIDSGREFSDKELVKIMRKAIKKSAECSVQTRLHVYSHMIIVETWQYES